MGIGRSSTSCLLKIEHVKTNMLPHTLEMARLPFKQPPPITNNSYALAVQCLQKIKLFLAILYRDFMSEVWTFSQYAKSIYR